MNISNKLTMFRMFLIPVFMIILMSNFFAGEIILLGTLIQKNHFIAAIIFIVASFTDYLDGYLARKYQLVTSFGAFFDPMADKLLVIAALVLLIVVDQIPAWIVVIIISRELLVTGLRVLLAQHDGKVMAAAMPGKIKTTTQMLAIIFYLLNNLGFNWLPFSIAEVLLYTCLIFTIYSGVDYFCHAKFVFDGPK